MPQYPTLEEYLYMRESLSPITEYHLLSYLPIIVAIFLSIFLMFSILRYAKTGVHSAKYQYVYIAIIFITIIFGLFVAFYTHRLNYSIYDLRRYFIIHFLISCAALNLISLVYFFLSFYLCRLSHTQHNNSKEST